MQTTSKCETPNAMSCHCPDCPRNNDILCPLDCFMSNSYLCHNFYNEWKFSFAYSYQILLNCQNLLSLTLTCRFGFTSTINNTKRTPEYTDLQMQSENWFSVLLSRIIDIILLNLFFPATRLKSQIYQYFNKTNSTFSYIKLCILHRATSSMWEHVSSYKANILLTLKWMSTLNHLRLGQYIKWITD